jgi:hypothetical protein
MPCRRVALACLFLAVSAGVARAEEGAVEEAHHVLRASFGMFSALGFGGLSYAIVPTRHLEIEAGIGYGFTGVQYSGMVRLREGTARNQFILGAGSSYATGQAGGSILWGNLEMGYEHRFASGLSIAIVGGATVALSGTERAGCWFCFDEDDAGVVLPQARTMLGYWF